MSPYAHGGCLGSRHCNRSQRLSSATSLSRPVVDSVAKIVSPIYCFPHHHWSPISSVSLPKHFIHWHLTYVPNRLSLATPVGYMRPGFLPLLAICCCYAKI